MEPVISTILNALVVGMAAVLKPTAEQAVKDAYDAVKKIITEKYKIGIDNLEQKPDSDAQKAAVAEALGESTAASDADLISKVEQLLAEVKKTSPEVAKTVGVNLENIEADIARIHNVLATQGSTGVNVKDSKFNNLDISDINSGSDSKKN